MQTLTSGNTGPKTVLLIKLDAMDQLLNIYANIERPSGNPSKRKREAQISENIYENVFINTLEANRTGPALSGIKYMKIRKFRRSLYLLQTGANRTDF